MSPHRPPKAEHFQRRRAKAEEVDLDELARYDELVHQSLAHHKQLAKALESGRTKLEDKTSCLLHTLGLESESRPYFAIICTLSATKVSSALGGRPKTDRAGVAIPDGDMDIATAPGLPALDARGAEEGSLLLLDVVGLLRHVPKAAGATIPR